MIFRELQRCFRGGIEDLEGSQVYYRGSEGFQEGFGNISRGFSASFGGVTGSFWWCMGLRPTV